MKHEENEKRCENCRHYLAHYIKDYTRYLPIYCGHCINDNYKNRRKKPLTLCEHWESIGIQKDERKQCIKETLIFMSQRLDEIVMLLEDDAKN